MLKPEPISWCAAIAGCAANERTLWLNHWAAAGYIVGESCMSFRRAIARRKVKGRLRLKSSRPRRRSPHSTALRQYSGSGGYCWRSQPVYPAQQRPTEGQFPQTIYPQTLGIYIKKGNQALAQQLTSALKTLRENGEYSALLKKYAVYGITDDTVQ